MEQPCHCLWQLCEAQCPAEAGCWKPGSRQRRPKTAIPLGTLLEGTLLEGSLLEGSLATECPRHTLPATAQTLEHRGRRGSQIAPSLPNRAAPEMTQMQQLMPLPASATHRVAQASRIAARQLLPCSSWPCKCLTAMLPRRNPSRLHPSGLTMVGGQLHCRRTCLHYNKYSPRGGRPTDLEPILWRISRMHSI